MAEELLNSFDAAKQLGIGHRRLMRLVEAGIVRPQIVNSNDTRWSEHHLCEARAAIALRDSGYSTNQLRDAVKFLIAAGYNPLSGKFLIVRGTKGKPRDLLRLTEKEGEAVSALRRGQRVLFLAETEAPPTPQEKRKK